MDINTFKVEEWMNEYEKEAVYDIAQTCVNTLSLGELFSIAKVDSVDFFQSFSKKTLGYGHIKGNPEFKKGICNLYNNINPDQIVPTAGAAGANYLVFYSLVEPGERVISVLPTYQQLYSIPESLGADVQILHLRPENKFLPDLDELKSLINNKTKLICLNNPNNPSGSLMPPEMTEEIVRIAHEADAYVLCDEVYRGLGQTDDYVPSIVDVYEKGISTSSMSKVFSLPGIRLGWAVSRDAFVINSLFQHREYNLISCPVLEEEIAALALANADYILNRNTKIIRENLELLDGWVNREEHFSYIKPAAGTTALVYYDFNISSKEFCDRASKECGIFLTPGFCFELEKCIRIGYACDKVSLIAGLEKLSEFAQNLV